MKKEKEIKAEIWSVKVCGSAIDMVHGAYQIINEIYIPSEKIACNLSNKYLNCFKTEMTRYITDGKNPQTKLIAFLTLTPKFVEKAKKYVKLQEEINLNVDKILVNYDQPIKTNHPIKVIPSVTFKSVKNK